MPRGSGAVRPIVRCRFEPPVPARKKAVHRFAALIIASAVAITPAQAQCQVALNGATSRVIRFIALAENTIALNPRNCT